MAAVRHDYALMATAAGPYHQFTPDYGTGHPSGVNLEVGLPVVRRPAQAAAVMAFGPGRSGPKVPTGGASLLDSVRSLDVAEPERGTRMRTGLVPKTALAALAATALFLPFGAPLPGSCVRAIGVAGAAPSRSCSGDLRECLRASADMHQTTFGGRYVTAEDVARCMETFRSCTSGGASRSTPKSTAKGSDPVGLPTRFRIQDSDGMSHDCRIAGDTVNCSSTWPTAPDWVDSWEGTVTGTLTGLTMTGTAKSHLKQVPGESGCIAEADYSGPVTYIFSLAGTVDMRMGPAELRATNSGTCSGTGSNTVPAYERGGKWSALE